MAEEAVIFPSAPLFMVDRGWQRQRRKGSKSAPSNYAEKHSSRVPEVTILIMKSPSKAVGKKAEALSGPKPSAQSPKKNMKLRFMTDEPAAGAKREPPRKKTQVILRSKNGSSRKRKPASNIRNLRSVDDEELIDQVQPSPTMTRTVSGTTLPLFNIIDPEVSGFQDLLNYCKCSSLLKAAVIADTVTTRPNSSSQFNVSRLQTCHIPV